MKFAANKPPAIWTVAVGPDSRTILTGDTSGQIIEWNTEKGNKLRKLYVDDLRSLSLSPDGRYLLTGGDSWTVQLWDLQTGLLDWTWKNEDDLVQYVSFSNDGTRAVFGGIKNAAFLWDMHKRKLLRTFHAPWPYGHELYRVALSPDHQFVAGAYTKANTAVVWNSQTGCTAGLITSHFVLAMTGVAFSRDSRYLVTGGKTLHIWDLVSGEQTKVLRLQDRYLVGPIFSPDGRSVLAIEDDVHLVHLIDIETGTQYREFSGHGDDIIVTAFSSDGAYILTGSGDGTARLWETASGKEVQQFSHRMD